MKTSNTQAMKALTQFLLFNGSIDFMQVNTSDKLRDRNQWTVSMNYYGMRSWHGCGDTLPEAITDCLERLKIECGPQIDMGHTL